MISIFSKQVWLEEQLQAATIQIKNGRIHAVIKEKKENAAQDFGELIIMPGVIDAHVHINEPGRTEWEGFETATKAAARGGTTMLVDMPLNSSPVVVNTSAFDGKIRAAKGQLNVNCGFWAGAVNEQTEEAIALIKRGCLGVKVFLSHSGLEEFPNISLPDLDQLMAAVQPYDVPVLAHCEFDTLPAQTNIKNQPQSYSEYLKSRPKNWENEAVRAFVALGQKNNCKTHIVHLSSQDLIPWLNKQKEKGNLSVETCVHYLLFDAEHIDDGNTLYKCAPPIREQANNQQLKQALKNGTLDFITTDHSPAPPSIKELKSGNLDKAWGGIAGLQFLLSGSWTALKDTLNIAAFIPLLTSKPAQFLGLDQQMGFLKEGYQANITIWNPNESFLVTPDIIEHKHKATPYSGMQLSGVVKHTMVNGQWVFSEDAFLNLGKGELVLRVVEH